MPHQDAKLPNLPPQYQRKLVKTHIAARIVGLSCRMITHLAQTGVLPAVRTGRRKLEFHLADIENLRKIRLFAQECGIRVRYNGLTINGLCEGKADERSRQEMTERDFPAETMPEKIGGTLSAPNGEQ